MKYIDSLQARDAKAVIHSLTDLSLHAVRGASVIQSGKGVWVRDIEGREYIEAMSALNYFPNTVESALVLQSQRC